MIAWMPVVLPVAAAVLFAILSVGLEQTQNKQKVSSENKPRPVLQKKPV